VGGASAFYWTKDKLSLGDLLAKNAGKLLLLLFIGALSMAFASTIAGRVGAESGLSSFNTVTSFIVSITLFLVGGLLWIVVAAGMRHHD